MRCRCSRQLDARHRQRLAAGAIHDAAAEFDQADAAQADIEAAQVESAGDGDGRSGLRFRDAGIEVGVGIAEDLAGLGIAL